jgi:hypothetical protein
MITTAEKRWRQKVNTREEWVPWLLEDRRAKEKVQHYVVQMGTDVQMKVVLR